MANNPGANSQGAVFLDRDGVIIEDIGYLGDPALIRFIPGAPAAIRRLNERAVKVIVVTNQAGVARGYYPESAIAAVHRRISELLAAESAHVDAFFYCPHHPRHGLPPYRQECACRKPQPGMILQGAAQFGADLARSVLIGDKHSDILAAHNAGTRSILVMTGYGRAHWSNWSDPVKPDFIAEDLPSAVDLVIPLL
ncbi:MAG: HAD family hydrolase [Acidobacteria bacterium]|nr:HAD family hydrolase [Acidobacteriota bacterium]